MSLLTKAFTLSGLARSPWILGGIIAFFVAFGGAAFTMGYSTAADSCASQKSESREGAALDAASANRDIADIRVESERNRADIREEFDDITEKLEDLETLQADLVANGCTLDPERLRELNRAILRAGGTD